MRVDATAQPAAFAPARRDECPVQRGNDGRRHKGGGSATLRLLGDISYPLYVAHIPLFYLLKRASLESPTLYLAITVALSLLLYWGLDKYSQQRSPATADEGLDAVRPMGRPETRN